MPQLTLRAKTMFPRPAASLIATIGVFSAFALAETSIADGPQVGNGYYYSFKDEACGTENIADPITVFFVGTGATPRRLAGYERGGPFEGDVEGDITVHNRKSFFPFLKRHNTDNLFRQWWEPFDCKRNPGDTDLATAAGFGNRRIHLRMWQMRRPSRDKAGFVVTTPHIEDWTDNGDCGKVFAFPPRPGSHAVERGAVDRGSRLRERRGSGFDRGRRYLTLTYKGSRHHHVDAGNRFAGNTRSVKQCDGEYAGSNGNTTDIGIGRLQRLRD